MSYIITCYCNDSTIKKTSVYIAAAGTYSGIYGSNSLGDYEEFTVSGLTNSWSAKFTATPASDCEFSYWIYRVGSTDAAPQYSYENPFTYTGGQDIYIRAVGESTATSQWTAWQEEYFEMGDYEQSVDIYNYYTDSYTLEPYNVHRYTVRFSRSGYAHFYTISNIDTYGYLSDGYDWNNENSGPLYVIAEDDNSSDGSNFDIEYYVTADVEYNIYVRGYSGEESGAVTLVIMPPTPTWSLNAPSSANFGTITADKTQSISVSNYTLYRRSVTFNKSGTATFYTTGSLDTKGYLTTLTAWSSSSGEPTSSNILASDDDAGADSNFSFTYDVTAGTTYYIWARGYSGDYSGTTTLHIEIPEAVTVDKWSWSASNGSASASATSKAHTAASNQGVVSNFSYLVWNDMVDKVVEILTALGDTWDSSYLSVANTKMASSDKTLTAVRYNSLRYNVGSHYSTGISDKATGEYVYGSYITTLTNCMNSWIDRDL